MRSLALLALVSMTLTACAALTARPKGKLLPAYISGEGLKNPDDADDVRAHLTRSDTGFYGNFMVEATLYTPALVAAKARTRGKHNLDSPERINAAIAAGRIYHLERTCWLVSIETKNAGLDSARLSSWVLKARDSSGAVHDVTDLAGRRDDVPDLHFGLANEARYSSMATMCTKKLDHAKGFDLILIPQAGDDYAKKPIELRWEPAGT